MKRSIILGLVPSVVAAGLAGTNMAVVHPRAPDSLAAQPFFWDRSHTAGSISSAEVSQSVLRLLGGPAVSAAAAKDLPSPDAVSPPRAAVVVALTGAGQTLPKLEALMGHTVSVRDTEAVGLAASVARRVHGGLSALKLSGYTACVSADDAVRDSAFCRAASDAVHWDASAFAATASTRVPKGFLQGWGGADVAALASAVEASGMTATAKDMTLTVQPKGDPKGEVVTFDSADASEGFFLKELSVLVSLPAALKPPLLAAAKAHPDLILLTLEGLGGLSPAKMAAAATLLDCCVAKALGDLSGAYGESLAAQLVVLPDSGRRLATPAMSPTTYSPSQTKLTLDQIVSYQLALWTGIGLILTLLSALCCMVNMEVKPDSLLYAKFQADVSSKSE